ncbi:hypothetical protein BCR44DRAFT_1445829 [Catenaria anguillulae PL171]|uniref:Uncharacterized protein n=1 Tax=Catenaria anguillulae PL171 TaxID=765915 RepID=A0A1Y2H6I4_9FUNG|nr:hypothetical protein BCR44DRAFT_1445829 [Catenaria anguillulae PL171]
MAAGPLLGWCMGCRSSGSGRRRGRPGRGADLAAVVVGCGCWLGDGGACLQVGSDGALVECWLTVG